jgi:hypothetical protein
MVGLYQAEAVGVKCLSLRHTMASDPALSDEKSNMHPSGDKTCTLTTEILQHREYSVCFYPCCLQGVDPSSFLKTHVQGVLNHGQKTFDTYLDLNEYCHDSNLIMNVLLRTVHDSIGKV